VVPILGVQLQLRSFARNHLGGTMSMPAEKPLRTSNPAYATNGGAQPAKMPARQQIDSYAMAELQRRHESTRRLLALAQKHF
jgi:hypothetical protein